MFTVGFEKTAVSKKYRTDNEKKRRYADAYGKVFAGAGVGVIGTGTALVPMITAPAKHDPRKTEAVMSDMTKKHRLSLSYGRAPHRLLSNYGESLTHPHGHINLHPSGSPAIAAHELGHAVDLGKKGKGYLRLRGYGRRFGPLAGLAGAAGLLHSEDSKKKKLAPAAILLGSAPLLYDEAAATTHALASLKRVGGTKQALKGLAELGPAFASYAAVPVGLAYGFHRAAKHLNEKDK